MLQIRVANSLHRVRKHADALFRAIACGWSRRCHERHGAMLCLQPRCQEEHQVLQAASRGGKRAVRFTVLYSWQKQVVQESVSYHETLILTLDEDSPYFPRRVKISPLRRSCIQANGKSEKDKGFLREVGHLVGNPRYTSHLQ